MFYTHAQLDRADHLRKDQAKQNELYAQSNAQLLPVWNGKLLVGEGRDAIPEKLSIPSSHSLTGKDNTIFLGLIGEQPFFALSISSIDENDLTQWTTLAQSIYPEHNNIRFDDLRIIGPTLLADEGALMAYARGIVYWHDTVKFCSSCSRPLHSINAGHIKVCDNDNCKHQAFPRTDPAVIMLVTLPATTDSPALCLLGRNQAWPPGVFSTLAGFVETGESLEQAVQREVFEEANIRTEDVRYIASQPWPFPRSIMLGFEATATTKDITIDPDELEDAQWFNAEQLKTFGTWGDENYEFQLPRPDSIARFLIDRWVNAQ